MDRKSFLVLLISFLLLMVWYPLTSRLFPPLPAPEGTNTVTKAHDPIATNTAGESNQSVASASPSMPSVPAGKIIVPAAPEETITITNENARYTFTSHGGALKFAELVKYPATISCDRKERTNQINLATLNRLAPLPALAVLGGEAVEGDGLFKLTPTPTGLRAEKALSNGVYLIKDFALSTNYLIKATVRFENRSAQPVALPACEWVVGTATPMGHRDETQTLGGQWYDGQRAEDVFVGASSGCFGGQPRTEFSSSSTNILWASANN